MITFINLHVSEQSDQQFMIDLYHQYGRLMFATARKYISDQDTCEDIIQDAIVKLIGKISILRSLNGCTLAAYIVSTIRNTSINHLRRCATERSIIDVYEELPEDIAAPLLPMDDIMSTLENKEMLYSVWENLDDEDRILLEGKYFLDFSDKELADALGCKASSIRMKLTRARRKMMTKLIDGGYQYEKL